MFYFILKYRIYEIYEIILNILTYDKILVKNYHPMKLVKFGPHARCRR